MSVHDWYRNETWNREVETDFEARLKRSRGAFHKGQYLRIQAGILLESSDKSAQLVGVRLMERLFAEYPTETSSIILGQEQLGDYYLKNMNFDKAEYYFRLLTDHYEKAKSRSGTSFLADAKLAEVILRTNQVAKFEEAYEIISNFPIEGLTFNNAKFYFVELAAHLCDAMNKKEEAKEYAKAALQLSTITQPQFYRHKTIGLVKASDKQLRTLEQISAE